MKKENFKSLIIFLLINLIFANSFEFQQVFIYDDNIFKFSQKDLDLFLKGEKDKDYKTADDLITAFGLKLNFYKTAFSLSLQTEYKGFLQNRKKSYQEYQTSIKFSKINLIYSFLPNYYLRNFYQKPCIYTEHSISLKIDLENFLIGIKNEIDLYNEDFKYYNANSFSTILKYKKDIKINYQIINNLTLTRNWLINKLKEKEPDISYFQIGNEIKIRRRGEIFDLILIFGIKRRDYLTKIDLTHKNRIDYLYSLSFQIPIKFKRTLSIIFGYNFEKRICQIPYKEEFEDIKNYQKNIIFLK
ncbi:MAG: hypothetical protein RMJ34_02285, partial [candidate division WOR-3 bacterium]|nr:hypothetical protein [candidate division WOR-3 bacterium]